MARIDPSRPLRWLACAALAALLPAPPAGAQELTLGAERGEVAAAAKAALADALALARRTRTLESLGLRSAAEAGRATLGPPLAVREIGFDRLVAWQAGSDPAAVLVGPPQALVPVQVGDEVRGALTLVRTGRGWELTRYGDAGRAAQLERARAGAAEAVLLDVPSLRIELLAVVQGGRTVVTPVEPLAAAEAGIDGPLELGEAVARLAARARAVEQEHGDAIRQRRIAR